VKRTAALIKNGADVPRSPEFLQDLERFERYVNPIPTWFA
jgi:hypothetical protein